MANSIIEFEDLYLYNYLYRKIQLVGDIMFWIYDKKIESTKIKNNKLEFDIRDGLTTTQRTILQVIKYLCDENYNRFTFTEGLQINQIKKELKANKLHKTISEANLEENIKILCNSKYPILSINSKNEICVTYIFYKMFEGQDGTDYCSDFVLSSVFPNLLCNGENGYMPHDIKNVVKVIERFIENKAISDSEIHSILADDSSNDLKKLVEAFANHRINVLGRANRIQYELFDKSVRIFKYGTEKEKQKVHFDVSYYENLKNEVLESYSNISKVLIEEQKELLEDDTLLYNWTNPIR